MCGFKSAVNWQAGIKLPVNSHSFPDCHERWKGTKKEEDKEKERERGREKKRKKKRGRVADRRETHCMTRLNPRQIVLIHLPEEMKPHSKPRRHYSLRLVI